MSFVEDISTIIAENANELLGSHQTWERVKAGEVSRITNGFAFKSDHFSNESGVPILRIRDILQGKASTFYNGPNVSAAYVEHGELVIGMDGDFNSRLWPGQRALINQRVCKLIPDKRYYSTRFLSYVLPGYLKAINDATSSVTVKHLSSNTILELPLPLPPPNEQERISNKLDELFSELDAGVASLKRARALLKKYRQAVRKAAVTGELTGDWRERHRGEIRESGAELLQRILKARRAAWEATELKKLRAKGKPPRDDGWKQKYQEPQPPDTAGLPNLPEGWVWATVDQLCVKVANGLSKKPRGGPPGAPILRISAVRPMSVDLNDIRYYPTDTGEDLDEYVVNRGDLLFTRYNGSFELVGVCGAITAEKAILHPDKLIRAKLASQEMTDAELLAAFLSAGVSRVFIEGHIKTTAGQHGIAGSDIKRAPIPLPPVSEQQAIISLIAEAWTSSDQTEQSIETELLRADRTRQGILKAAFAGRLVPQDPNDEPASVLLERIRAERAAKPKPARGRRMKAGTHGQMELLS